MMKRRMMAAFVSLAILLSACGGNGDGSELLEETVLVLAAFDDNAYLRKQVELYNQAHSGYRIEIQRYERSEQLEEDGILLLQREIAAGEGPDIIDFGSGYSNSDIVGRYTEDLFPYLEAEDGEAYFENIINAFSYGPELYAIPLGFTLKSFAGRKSNLGERNSWTIREMLECCREQEQDRLLYPGAFKMDVFGTILTGSMEYYIDWETGECRFNGEEFRDVMEFCNGFADRLDFTEDFSVKQTFLDDKALLLPIRIGTIFDICSTEFIFDGQEVTFIGFPVEGKSGTMIESSGPVLAIGRNSANKKEAWEFIRLCLGEPAQRELPSGFPLCRSVLQEQIAEAMEIEYETDENGIQNPVAKDQVLFEGEDPVAIYCITQKQADQLLALIGQAEASSQIDRKMYNIFLDEAEYYFNGAKTLEETTDIIQARTLMYVNERKK